MNIFRQKDTIAEKVETLKEEQSEVYEKGWNLYDRKDKVQEDINLLFSISPKMSENLRIAQLCKGIGLAIDTIKQLFNGETVTVTGTLHSLEHDCDFNVQDAKLQLFKGRDDPDKLLLKLHRQNILDWFRQKYQELKAEARPHIKNTPKPESNNYNGFKR